MSIVYICVHLCVCVWCVVSVGACSLSEYADLYGKIPEEKIWCILLDLVKVSLFMMLYDNAIQFHGCRV